MNLENLDVSTLILMQIPIFGLLLFAYIFFKNHKNDTVQHNSSKVGHKTNDITTKFNHNKSTKNGSRTSIDNNNKRTNYKNKNHHHTHPWLASNLKGHTDEIRDIDFSSNGKYLASCAEDRTILIWSTEQLLDSKSRKHFRLNSTFDYATKLSWSPDNKAIVFHQFNQNNIAVFRLKKHDGWFNGVSRFTLPKLTDDEIIGFGVSCTGRFLMLCTNKTTLYICDLKGNILEELDTCLMNNYSAKISTCGRFIAASGFSPDCKIWEVKFTKTGEYQKTVRAFDLSGHTSGIYDIAFDQDSSHIATISKDGTWKLYDTKIEYESGQMVRCLKTGKYTQRSDCPLIALSLNADVLAIGTGNRVELYSMFTGERDQVISNIYSDSIRAIKFDPLGKLLLTAGDKQIRVYHNLTGYKTTVNIAKNKLKKGGYTTATKERLENQIIESEEFLKKFE